MWDWIGGIPLQLCSRVRTDQGSVPLLPSAF